MLVGRTTEQRRIGQVLEAARNGRASVLHLVGDPGQGKTALLVDAQSHAHGMTVLHARGLPSETHVPFAGLFELLRPVLGLLDRLPAPQARALQGALALRPGTAQDRFAVGAATLGLLAAVAEEAPLLVVVDDAHALDEASASALLFAVRRALADCIGVLLAARPEPSLLDAAGLPLLRLSGLDRQAAGELVQQVAAPVDADLMDRLHRETGGNPLALMELAAEPLAALRSAPPDAPLPVVPTVAEVYQRRCRALPPTTRRALLLAAAGESSDLLVLSRTARALGVDLADLMAAEAAGLVQVEAEGVAFRHPLVRSAVYADGSPQERREVHRALARALPDAEADRRAWHLALAAFGPDEAASAAMEQAGHRARARSAYDVAFRAYERAEQLATEEDRRAWLGLAAADAAWLSGQVEQAVRLVDTLRGRPASPRLRADVERLRGHITARCGPVPRAREILLAAAEQVTPTDPDTAVVLLAEAANAAFYVGESDAMQAIAERITAVVPAHPTPRTDFFATMAQGMALLFADDGSHGAPLVRQALAAVEPSAALADDPLVLVWLTMGPLWLREAGADDVVDAALEVTRERLAVGVLPFLLTHLALCRAAADRWPEAEAAFDEAIRLARETGQHTDLASALARLAWVEGRRGKESACRARAAEALALSRSLQLGLCELWAHAALIDLELGLGRPERALKHVQTHEALRVRLGVRDADMHLGPEAVDALLRLRRVEEAARIAGDYSAAAEAKGQPWALARAARCRAMVASDQDAEPLFVEALALHACTPDVFEAARTQLARGSRLRRAGERVRARTPLRDALEVLDRLGAEPWAEQARAELAATGETARRRHPGTAQDLTPQELHLALLLAGGKTTRQAAAAVFLSPKTVEYHLRSVYRKLGISSRQQLAERLDR